METIHVIGVTGKSGKSPSVLSNMFVSIEQHVEWIANCIENLVINNVESIEASAYAEDDWVEHARQVSEYTLFPLSNSWYQGANVPTSNGLCCHIVED